MLSKSVFSNAKKTRVAMKFTKHAKKQAQRRGIDNNEINLLLSYGEDIRARHGRRLIRVPHREMQYLAKECSPMLWRQYRDRLGKLAIVVDSSGQTIVTAMHRSKPIWKRITQRDMRYAINDKHSFGLRAASVAG